MGDIVETSEAETSELADNVESPVGTMERKLVLVKLATGLGEAMEAVGTAVKEGSGERDTRLETVGCKEAEALPVED